MAGDDEQDADIDVLVLGPVDVVGVNLPPGRRRLVEIIAFLVTHRSRSIQGDELRATLWPLGEQGDEIDYEGFKQAMSRTRAILGVAPDGTRYLPDARGGGYQVGPRVGCDWLRFRRLTARARRAPTADAIELFRDALALVRGTPFQGVTPGTYRWAWSEQLVSDIEVAIIDAAAHLARLALDSGDHETARWACERGRLAVPQQETLSQLKMEAAAAAGDRDALDQAWRETQRDAQSIDELDEPSPDTVLLYQQLCAALHEPKSEDGGR
jgi:hypothetical protein